MNGMKFDLQDLDLDEAGMHTELVITFHDGSASYILTDDELADLATQALARYQKRFIPTEPRKIRYEPDEDIPWASYRNGKLIGRDHSEQAAKLRQAAYVHRIHTPREKN